MATDFRLFGGLLTQWHTYWSRYATERLGEEGACEFETRWPEIVQCARDDVADPIRQQSMEITLRDRVVAAVDDIFRRQVSEGLAFHP